MKFKHLWVSLAQLNNEKRTGLLLNTDKMTLDNPKSDDSLSKIVHRKQIKWTDRCLGVDNEVMLNKVTIM